MSAALLVRDPVSGREYDAAEAARLLAFARWHAYCMAAENGEEEAGEGGTRGERDPHTTVGQSRELAPASTEFWKGAP
jgi:hypothetical protein